MKKSLILAGCAVFTLGLAGCGANNNAADDNGQQRVQINQVRRGPTTEENRLQLADRAERQVEQMPEVDDARVIISENNAYVAVRLADDNNGNAEVNDALDGNGRTFAENGRVDQDDNPAGNDGTIDGHGDAGDETDRNTARGDGLEREIEQKVRQSQRGIDNVYVSVDNNAFDRMGTFADDIRNNRNRDGLFDDFRNTMGNFFGR
ncbi:YhcN/YlaJ family sporulation lipoprotein [Bacillus sp. ISL-55]|uniref:YhcN/YlaJ family sporulation lipoprotein n=1 Tax=Bacillus sp. ISL-55 TaxID=2819134 RepID=UPI001BE7CFB8|nr:YhcN/YlaJ family sporulation lipoprotein [Bacillus sp. ISL-55]MBT2692761.1 YhcN/YlaJ family sporulation lipoprotein [Bacillus sp. ISL-55]